MSEQQRVRASDAEREQVAAALRQAMSEGRLTLAEGEERLAGVYATTYRDELPPFTADLPPDQPQPSPAGPDREGRDPRARRYGRHRGRPAIGLVTAGAVAAGLWAILGSGPVWLAILLGILAVLAVRHVVLGHHQPTCRDHGARHVPRA